MDNKEPTAYFTIQCWGCNKAVTRPYSGHDDIQHKVEMLKVAGWRRREFGPNASPWFCSEDCATNSYNAKQAEEWWAQKEFKEYCQKAAIPPIFWGPLLFATVLIAAALLGECFNAGIQ